MARVDLAAGFIKANMPFDQPRTLRDQDAWDVAAFIDSHERPKDPRQTGSVAENAKANFAGQKSYYGQLVGGKMLGTGVPGQR
jgi:thiosulfate dehydrogenase